MTDYLGYRGKACVITGAASGMARALTELLVDLGAEVYAIDRVDSPVPGVKQSFIADLGDQASIDALFTQLPARFDAFFGVAGLAGVHTSFLDTMTVNYTANKYITDTYLTERLNEGGSIAYVTSAGGLRWEFPEIREELAEFTDAAADWDTLVERTRAFDERHGGELAGFVGYMLSKRALNLFVAERVERFAAKQVRINAVLPSMTATGMLGDFAEQRGGMDNLKAASTGPAGRLAEPLDMARALVFLGSDLAGFISGVFLDVDYGMNALELAGVNPMRTRWTFADTLAKRAS
ncbi:SDR family oxidoreductase [Leucobacter luti]|uniref:NAD(P)-dependent dehydrogenase (Short-subunit alcohol dehydrogenase family) n=1 Tax=Leucobacter luti TaxID=340320 RepID=A0A4Q7U121_9MICO|nr:SDR family oxidoreductase [Leucobacter luti]MBL3699543.1 SDR family oxidoreductase [Leucobacter luti]RZT67055.1 NAD(P)-dependent dehydrogenase (short-subunit alcohol dehydrogenase family) [Leucobacter luti]